MAVGSLLKCPHCGNNFYRQFREKYCSDACRFWHKVSLGSETECWLWLGTKPAFGHGQFVSGGRVVYAHRHSWELRHGAVPVGKCVLHKCDVPACVNPSHLFLGTREDNMADMWAKRRGSNPPRRIGSSHHASKLTEDDVRAIRSSTKTKMQLAEHYGVARRTISHIINRNIWTHV